MTSPRSFAHAIRTPGLGLAFLLNLFWVNASEVFRYFVFVMPMLRQSLSDVSGVAPMNIPVFMAWGVWDTIVIVAIVGVSWLVFERFGTTRVAAIVSATATWLAIFVIFWFAMFNMNLATPKIVAIALPLAWLEMMVAALIVRWCLMRKS
jgi:hypothetical protein